MIFVANAKHAKAVPIASDPVSPINILAGAAFHHKPTHAPSIETATTARSNAWSRSYIPDGESPERYDC